MQTITQYPFHVIAKPIGPLCNLRCEYCFYLSKEEELFSRTTDFVMSDEMLENFISSYISEQPDTIDTVNFAWQGGEPTLLGIAFFQKVIYLQQKHNQKNKVITNGLQTNGTLIDDNWAQFLKANSFLVGISLDGPAEIHDKFRKNKKNEGSFEAVMRGIAALQRYSVNYNILTVVQSNNSQHPHEVYNFLKTTGTDYFQFIPIVEPDNTTDKKVSSRSVSPESWGKFLLKIFNLWLDNDIGNYYILNFENMLEMRFGYLSSMCTHAHTCGRAAIIEHNGDVYSCDHFVNQKNKLGNLTDTSFAEMLDSKQQLSFGAAKHNELSIECKKCHYLRLCHGGCPAHRISNTNNQHKHNYLCNGYKLFFRETEQQTKAILHCIKNNLPPTEYVRFL